MKVQQGELESYLQQVARAEIARLSRNELLAFLINAYRAYTIKSILDTMTPNRPAGVASIRDIPNVFGVRNHAVGGATLSLDNIEHKIETVMGYLPEHLKDQTQAAMRSAFRLPACEGMARLEKQAEWLERDYPGAAASLHEGLAEMFTVSRLGLSPSLTRCLVSTNVIESPHSGVRQRTRRVCRWRDGKMVLHWAAAAPLMTEQNFRKIMGYRDLWMLKAALDQKGGLLQQEVA